ncbi:MAG: sigma-70 family RNA polymerase sigma factor [Thermoanaerobaculia bacterium]
MTDESAQTSGVGGPLAPGAVFGEPDAAVAETFLGHALLLRRIATRKFRVPECDAEALVHDVFINYLVAVQRVQPYDLRAYLISAICNASRNYWRNRRSDDRIFSTVDLDDQTLDESSAADIFRVLSNTLDVASMLARLGNRCREILRRYYLEEQDTASIAAAIQTTCSNVNYLMHTCRKRARAAYEAIASRKW